MDVSRFSGTRYQAKTCFDEGYVRGAVDSGSLAALQRTTYTPQLTKRRMSIHPAFLRCIVSNCRELRCSKNWRESAGETL